MDNLILFLNSFCSYLLVFFVFCITIFIASKIGIALRKGKDAKLAAQESTEADGEAAQD